MKTLLTWRTAVIFLLACGLTFVLEHFIEKVTNEKGQPAVSQSLFSARGVYENLVTAWPRRLESRYTVLVKIDPAVQTMRVDGREVYLKDPFAIGLTNVCDQRRLMASLLRRIAAYEPAVIAVDKWFTAGVCDSNPQGTAELQAAIAEISRRLPVVIGLRVDKDAPPALRTAGGHRLVDTLEFPGASRLHEGIVNMDPDTRRLALGWVAGKPGAQPAYTHTLSVQTALAYDPRLLAKYPSLEEIRNHASRPYLSIMQGDRFAWYHAGDFFCDGNQPRAEHERWCAVRGAPAVDLSYLRGRIVLLGEINMDNDGHHTVVGFVPGMLLQANYVEALLDERYFKPAPEWINYLVGFLFFVAIELSLLARRALVALLWVVVSMASTFALLSLVARYGGYYLNPVTFSVFVLLLTLLSWARERMMKKVGVGHEAS